MSTINTYPCLGGERVARVPPTDLRIVLVVMLTPSVGTQLPAVAALFLMNVTGDVVIRDLRRDDRDAFVDVVAGAFARDPVFADLLESADHGRALVRYLFGFADSLGGTRIGLFVGDELAGAALVDPPGGVEWSVRMIAEAIRFLPLAVRMRPTTTRTLNTYLRISRVAAPAEPHHYLSMVAVAVEHQGAGHGRRLVDEVKELARRHPRSTGVALDTENPDNVELYTSMGFRLTEVSELGALRIHAMRWDIRPE